MAEPSIEQLHAALSSIFASPSPLPGRPAAAAAMSLADALKILREDLEFSGDKRKKGALLLPRVVHSVALWNLALRMLDPSVLNPAELAVRSDLDPLITNIFRRPLDEIRALRQVGIDPLLTFTRAHKIDQYLWEPPALKDGVLSAKLVVVVQTRVQAMEAVFDPEFWQGRNGLFWKDIKSVPRPDRQREGLAFKATLNLPGPAAAQQTPVVIEAIRFDLPLGFGCTLKIFGNGPVSQPPLLCTSTLTAEKEQGNPWATRITHEKQISPASLALGANVEDTLRFWIQAETVCLALP